VAVFVAEGVPLITHVEELMDRPDGKAGLTEHPVIADPLLARVVGDIVAAVPTVTVLGVV
jgi:hypothetical protein